MFTRTELVRIAASNFDYAINDQDNPNYDEFFTSFVAWQQNAVDTVRECGGSLDDQQTVFEEYNAIWQRFDSQK